MKNPLLKRLPRELKQDIGKYIAIFLFLTATIGFISGFLVADGSMKSTYDGSFEKYKIEDGHFELAAKADAGLINKLEAENVTIYENFYIEKTVRGDKSLRIFKNRTDVNLVCVMKGALPTADNEIAIDRLYAENSNVSIGDAITINGEDYTVCCLVALSDYSALFKSNSDMMFDAQKFSVALVTGDVFSSLTDSNLHYSYSWTDNDKSLTDEQKSDKADDVLKILGENTQVTDFVKQADNQAITFTGDDMGRDKSLYIWMLYIIMVVLAFIFAVTAKSTMEQESAVIGTLRASGYKKGELLRHYLTLPIFVTLAAAVVGNVLGYTLFKGIVAGMYYGSYSLPTYVTVWNGEAFFLTTVIPCIIILIVNLFILSRMLSLPPLAFLRRELTKHKKKHVIKLKRGRFLPRFRLRVIFQNVPTYITMFIGILLANILLMFGMIMTPLLDHYKTDVLNNQIANYQYILKAPVGTENDNAEKYCVTSLDTEKKNEEVTIYGIADNSKYLPNLFLPTGQDEVVVSDGYMEKYGLKVGDTIALREPYKDKSYTFTIKSSYHYPAGLAVFMTAEQYRIAFDKDDGYFTGYFSDEELTDVNDAYIVSVITQHDLTVVTDQLDDSMGNMMPLFCGFAVLLFVLIIYLLSKLIIEKNASSISMVKILGYNDREIGKLYNTATAIVIGTSLAASLPVVYLIMKGIYYVMMQSFNGWLDFYVDPFIYPKMLLLGMGSYAFISFLQSKRIKKIPMSQALKNME